MCTSRIRSVLGASRSGSTTTKHRNPSMHACMPQTPKATRSPLPPGVQPVHLLPYRRKSPIPSLDMISPGSKGALPNRSAFLFCLSPGQRDPIIHPPVEDISDKVAHSHGTILDHSAFRPPRFQPDPPKPKTPKIQRQITCRPNLPSHRKSVKRREPQAPFTIPHLGGAPPPPSPGGPWDHMQTSAPKAQPSKGQGPGLPSPVASAQDARL